MSETYVSVHYAGAVDSTDTAGEFDAADLRGALELAADPETWRDTSGRGIDSVMVWVDGECVETFLSAAEAAAALEVTTR